MRTERAGRAFEVVAVSVAVEKDIVGGLAEAVDGTGPGFVFWVLGGMEALLGRLGADGLPEVEVLVQAGVDPVEVLAFFDGGSRIGQGIARSRSGWRDRRRRVWRGVRRDGGVRGCWGDRSRRKPSRCASRATARLRWWRSAMRASAGAMPVSAARRAVRLAALAAMRFAENSPWVEMRRVGLGVGRESGVVGEDCVGSLGPCGVCARLRAMKQRAVAHGVRRCVDLGGQRCGGLFREVLVDDFDCVARRNRRPSRAGKRSRCWRGRIRAGS